MALAYYTVFSLGPLLIIAVAIAGFVSGQDVARQQILAQLQGLMGPQGVEFIETAMANANKPSWIGVLMTSLLFVIGKFILGFYLGNSQIGTTYGAAGSLLIVLIWIYYSAQILFFGAEFTKVFATRYGRGVVPAPNAVRVTEQVEA